MSHVASTLSARSSSIYDHMLCFSHPPQPALTATHLNLLKLDINVAHVTQGPEIAQCGYYREPLDLCNRVPGLLVLCSTEGIVRIRLQG